MPLLPWGIKWKWYVYIIMETAVVTGGKPIAVWSQSISGVGVIKESKKVISSMGIKIIHVLIEYLCIMNFMSMS
jgi:hypothetical protein